MDGIFRDIVNFIAKNKDTISNVASVASSVADSVNKKGNKTLDKKTNIKKLRCKPAISDDAINKELNVSDTPKTGNGFFYV